MCSFGRSGLRLSPGSRCGCGRRGVAATLLCVCIAAANADIFRYQDQFGNWHFTDEPPRGIEAERILDIVETTEPRAAEPVVDLVGQLEGAYDTITPIARATLAAVTVKSPIGEASGFFCSADGHILTNRHVLRPTGTAQHDARDDSVKGQEADVERLGEELEAAQERLDLMQKDLEGYQRVLDRTTDDAAHQWAREAHDRLSSRYREEQERVRSMSEKLGEMSKHVKKSRRDLDWERTSAAAATSFDVVLKDGTELVAELVDTGAHHDLALLKVDGVRTPYLRLDQATALSQGQRVFAVGSPLGMQDSVTSGVITQITAASIYTDAQILPGNSGGPLITD